MQVECGLVPLNQYSRQYCNTYGVSACGVISISQGDYYYALDRGEGGGAISVALVHLFVRLSVRRVHSE